MKQVSPRVNGRYTAQNLGTQHAQRDERMFMVCAHVLSNCRCKVACANELPCTLHLCG